MAAVQPTRNVPPRITHLCLSSPFRHRALPERFVVFIQTRFGGFLFAVCRSPVGWLVNIPLFMQLSLEIP